MSQTSRFCQRNILFKASPMMYNMPITTSTENGATASILSLLPRNNIAVRQFLNPVAESLPLIQLVITPPAVYIS